MPMTKILPAILLPLSLVALLAFTSRPTTDFQPSASHPADAVVSAANDPASAVAGRYTGTTHIDLLDVDLPLSLTLRRVHADSIQVVIRDFRLPTGQVFNFTSAPVLVKARRDGNLTVHDLSITFTHTYNNMPVTVTATGTVAADSLSSRVTASLMGMMETGLTYNARRQATR